MMKFFSEICQTPLTNRRGLVRMALLTRVNNARYRSIISSELKILCLLLVSEWLT